MTGMTVQHPEITVHDAGIRVQHPGIAVQLPPKSAFTFLRNRCSRSAEIRTMSSRCRATCARRRGSMRRSRRDAVASSAPVVCRADGVRECRRRLAVRRIQEPQAQCGSAPRRRMRADAPDDLRFELAGAGRGGGVRQMRSKPSPTFVRAFAVDPPGRRPGVAEVEACRRGVFDPPAARGRGAGKCRAGIGLESRVQPLELLGVAVVHEVSEPWGCPLRSNECEVAGFVGRERSDAESCRRRFRSSNPNFEATPLCRSSPSWRRSCGEQLAPVRPYNAHALGASPPGYCDHRCPPEGAAVEPLPSVDRHAQRSLPRPQGNDDSTGRVRSARPIRHGGPPVAKSDAQWHLPCIGMIPTLEFSGQLPHIAPPGNSRFQHTSSLGPARACSLSIDPLYSTRPRGRAPTDSIEAGCWQRSYRLASDAPPHGDHLLSAFLHHYGDKDA